MTMFCRNPCSLLLLFSAVFLSQCGPSRSFVIPTTTTTATTTTTTTTTTTSFHKWSSISIIKKTGEEEYDTANFKIRLSTALFAIKSGGSRRQAQPQRQQPQRKRRRAQTPPHRWQQKQQQQQQQQDADQEPTTTTTRSSTDILGNDMQSIPMNLRRKVNARRPALGHIVPMAVRVKGSGGSANPKLRPQGKAREQGLNNPSMLKILGGSAKGRRLDSPQVYLRPMMGKVKEAVFSTLTSFGLYAAGRGGSSGGVTTLRHLDVFAGSGSVGLESLSRGASHCTFVDLSDDCCSAIARNLEWCQFVNSDSRSVSGNDSDDDDDDDDRARIVCGDALKVLREPASYGIPTMTGVSFDLVTLCPPYEEVVYADLMDAVGNSPLVGDDTVVLVEYPIELGTFPHVLDVSPERKLVGLRNRRYGRTVIAMYIVNPTGSLEGADPRPEEFVD